MSREEISFCSSHVPVQLIRGDLTTLAVDAVVNATNPRLTPNGGLCGELAAVAGPKFVEACAKAERINVGEAVVTPGFNLPCRWVIHTTGPRWIDGEQGEDEDLARCYRNCLRLALEKNCRTIAFPLISMGLYRFPMERAMYVAWNAIHAALEEFDPSFEVQVSLVVYEPVSACFDDDLFRRVEEAIDEESIEIYAEDENDTALDSDTPFIRSTKRHHEIDGEPIRPGALQREDSFIESCADVPPPQGLTRVGSLDDLLAHRGKPFAKLLMERVNARGEKPSDVYKRANICKQHYSKIISKSTYHPSKQTVVAFAAALELTYDELTSWLRTAGYALSDADRFDLVITHCFLNKLTDVLKINALLYKYDLPLLGNSVA